MAKRAAPRAKSDLNDAGAAVANDQTEPATNASTEIVGAIEGIRMLITALLKIVLHSIATVFLVGAHAISFAAASMSCIVTTLVTVASGAMRLTMEPRILPPISTNSCTSASNMFAMLSRQRTNPVT